MNALKRFIVLGAQDADRRVAALLARPSLDAADRYVQRSGIVTAIDRAMLRASAWWSSSETRRWMIDTRESFAYAPVAERYRAIGVMLLTAAIVHVVFTVAQGPRPGLFWMIIPGMAAAFALLVLIASRASQLPQ